MPTSVRRLRNFEGKRFLVRVDFNVPIKKGEIIDDQRIRAHIPTIRYLTKKKAKVILVAHLGRPGGKRVKSLSLFPIAKRLSALLKKQVRLIEHPFSLQGKKQLAHMRQGGVVLLENIRFWKEEQENNDFFARDLAALADVFVQDGFGVMHRKSASIVGITKYLPSYQGLLLQKEMRGLDNVLDNPRSPFVLVLGGAKVKTKIPVLQHLLPQVDKVLLGGGLITTALAANGYEIGDSLVEKELFSTIKQLAKRKKILTPVDVVVGKKNGKQHRVETLALDQSLCQAPEGIFDIGPQTIALYEQEIKQAKTIVWNGAMGYFEQHPYHIGTMSLAAAIAKQSLQGAFTVVGGGETVQALQHTNMAENIDLVSTGGGAMLSYLAEETMPGIQALDS